MSICVWAEFKSSTYLMFCWVKFSTNLLTSFWSFIYGVFGSLSLLFKNFTIIFFKALFLLIQNFCLDVSNKAQQKERKHI